ncbi:MAG: hypothetical protein HOQ03_06325, partial [Thermoleophilia bacterium]|nr:hypothetical protein [Thermoleophilia bacterium]
PYTRALVATVPDLSHGGSTTLVPIPGEVPDIAAPPAGCAFHPRCQLRIDRCAHDLPALERRSDGRRVACHVVNADLDATRIESRTSAESTRPSQLGMTALHGEAEAV